MIEINNLTTARVDKDLLKKVSRKVLKEEKIKKKIDLSIALLKPKRMKEINKRYRGKDRATDVLAFSLIEGKAKFLQKESGLGEIIICPSEIKKNAKRFNSNFRKELKRALIHGILHLLGYDHERSKSKLKKMEAKQEYYLSKA